MLVRGALHVHSTLSRDGTMTIAELVQWYSTHGYQFIAMGEHAEDLNDAKVKMLVEGCARSSNGNFHVIPGIEIAGDRDIHILGVGVRSLIGHTDPLAVIDGIHLQGGHAILAHPKRINWEYPREVLVAVDAVEIWNVGYDGKYLPPARTIKEFLRMKEVNPRLLAVASHDFHRAASFYDVAIECDVPALSQDAILGNLRKGAYAIRSPFFRSNSQAQLSLTMAASLRLLSPQVANVRKARSLLLGISR